MTKEKYLMMCEQLHQEPKPEELPASFDDFPYIVQVAITIFGMLPDVWEGFSGTYMGKDFSILPYFAEKVYNIEDHSQLVQILMLINKIVFDRRMEEQKQRQRKNKNKQNIKKV